jgi:hypothetical protein
MPIASWNLINRLERLLLLRSVVELLEKVSNLALTILEEN